MKRFACWSVGITLVIVLFGMFACSNKDNPVEPAPKMSQISANIFGMKNLGNSASYVAWMVVGDETHKLGVFDVDDNGALSKTGFSINESVAGNATGIIISIETDADAAESPCDCCILAGDFTGNTAALNVQHDCALGCSFTQCGGIYQLGTPTNGPDTDETCGVWFMKTDGPGLAIEELPEGWIYEGWIKDGDLMLSTGRFEDPASKDMTRLYTGAGAAPNYPGEDFLRNAPTGWTFPKNLEGLEVCVTLEPDPDTSPSALGFKILSAIVPTPATAGTEYSMQNHSAVTLPGGTMNR